jgi:hypothetical protein
VLISLEGVKEALSVNAQWVDELFLPGGAGSSELRFDHFLEYLETGQLVSDGVLVMSLPLTR